MKKILCLIALGLLAACAQTNNNELQACLTEQAQKMVDSGAVSAAPMRTSVKKILKACGVQTLTPELKQQAQAILNEQMK